MSKTKLRCEDPDLEMGRDAREAFTGSAFWPHECAEAEYEHGQWWIVCTACGGAWSVNDADPGWDFEEVSVGDESCFDAEV